MKNELEHIKLAVVDDHNLFRKGIIKLIKIADTKGKYTILFEAGDGNELISKINQEALPDIILVDIDMPEMNGFELVAWLNKIYPDIKILVITMHETETAVLRMLRLGVKGYLSKDIEVEDMQRALEAISSNGYYYSGFAESVLNVALHGNKRLESNSDPHKINLSENELEFLKLATTELTYQQIADKMNLSPKTIDGYREALFQRLNVKTRVTLALYAIKHGIVKL